MIIFFMEKSWKISPWNFSLFFFELFLNEIENIFAEARNMLLFLLPALYVYWTITGSMEEFISIQSTGLDKQRFSV